MKYLSFIFLKEKSLRDYGIFLFLSGLFFLPSTLFIGILFLLPAAIIGSFLQKKSFLRDKWNYPFFVFGILILISAFLQYFVLRNNYEEIWDPLLSIIGTFNWLPFIWFFWAFQPFLDCKSKRRSLAMILIAGTFPVLITGFGQYFFDWNGPFKTLHGLIIWYQRPIQNPGGLSGLFNNQNYAGSWLNFIWPFCLALLLEKKNDILKKIVNYSFIFSVGFAAFLTYSRNAWLGLLISAPIMLSKKKFVPFLIILPIIVLVLFFTFFPLLTGEVQNNISNLIPNKLLLEFSEEGYKDIDASRIEIFKSALNLIKDSPIYGTGAASFPAVFLLETTFWKGHTHNLLLELAVSYGVPATLTFFLTVNFITFESCKAVFINENSGHKSSFDKAIWTAALFFLISQLVDVQYFDGKISIVFWVLIASLKNIIDENNNGHLITKN